MNTKSFRGEDQVIYKDSPIIITNDFSFQTIKSRKVLILKNQNFQQCLL